MAQVKFRLPDVGEGLEEGEVVSWLVATGDTVTRDQPLVEVQTDKALVELPSPIAGRVVRLAFAPGDMVKVGQVLVVLEDGAAGVPAAPPEPAPPETQRPAARPKAPPAVRKLAVELGVDLTQVTGTGPGGRILSADVQAAAQTPPATVKPGLGQSAPGNHPLRGIRRITAETMNRSWSEIPHITSMDELDATGLLEARKALGGNLSLVAFMVAAVARALRRHPLLNASVDVGAGEFTVHDGCHVGLAVATSAGLIVPVVRDANRRTLADLDAEIRRLTAAARNQRIGVADLSGGTFTISNYGSLGGRFATPLIRPPEVGIMGFGSIRPRPLAVDGNVVARPTLPYCLSADHRLIDGDLATAFAEDVAATLAAPIRLFAGH